MLSYRLFLWHTASRAVWAQGGARLCPGRPTDLRSHRAPRIQLHESHEQGPSAGRTVLKVHRNNFSNICQNPSNPWHT